MARIDVRAYCRECGDPLCFSAADNRAICANTRCRMDKAPDWSKGITPPGPVRFPTREEAMTDSRRLKWQPIETLPNDRTVLITREVRPQEGGGRWLIQRRDEDAGHPPWICGLPATHWAEDTMGTPVS